VRANIATCGISRAGRSLWSVNGKDVASDLDSGGRIGHLAGLVQRRPLFPGLMRAMVVVVPFILGQDRPEVLFAVDQQMAGARAAQCSHMPLRVGVHPEATAQAA
jgi:hypothetical protein